MSSKGKYIALDFGDRRIGVAISDLNKEVAFPREFIGNKNPTDALRAIQALCAAENVEKIIVGLPIQMDGTWGDRADKTQQFCEALRGAMPEMAIEFFDERLTSQQARKMLHGGGIKESKQKTESDSVAAGVILQSYLDSLRTR
jgi:putative Holliday junction resolvase